VGQKEPAVGPQKRPKTSPAMLGRGQDIRLKQPREEVLGQVEGFVGIMPLAAYERIDRIPVGRAQFGERRPRLGRGEVDRVGYAAPVGRRKAGSSVKVFQQTDPGEQARTRGCPESELNPLLWTL
jgi:hypothetical protein